MTLSSDCWRRLESLFYEALPLPPSAREAFIEEHCAGDEVLRREVESLLASADQPLEDFEEPIQEAAKQIVADGAAPELYPGDRFARYEVVYPIGAGGMGRVYLARDIQLRRNVALKLLAPELTRDERSLQRFEQEALAASALNHPNILTVYEFGEVEGTRYIAFEYVEGETLRQRIGKGRLEIVAVIDISIQIAGALAAAHARGIVHRDIKPDNVILRNDGIIKLLDFGIAKLYDRSSAELRGARLLSTSHTGFVLGTVRYMSPEQARGQLVDGRSDLFSLAVVMYEMATGQSAFQGETASDVIAEILKGEPGPLTALLPGVVARFETIIVRAMQKRREERYQSAPEMLADLQAFRKELEFQEKLHQLASPVEGSPGGGAPDNAPALPEKGSRLGQSALMLIRSGSWSRIALAVIAFVLIAGSIAIPSLRKRWAGRQVANSQHTLAVLPFRNLHPDAQTDYLGFSLADAIIAKLGFVNELTVRPSSSVDKYRSPVDPLRAAAELHVDTLLTGSYLREGDDLRITTQLIDVKPDKILWQDTIDLKYDRLITVEDTVSQRILQGLQVKLSPEEAEKVRPERGVNSVAYEYYLRGVDLYSLNNFPAAIGMLEKAAAIDPNYAPIWAHLGRAYTTNASLDFGGRENYIKAQAAYERAMALNPSLIEARVYLANLLTDTGRVELAVPLMRAVLQQNPGYAEAHWELGYAYRFGGMLRESVMEGERARQDNPSVKINSSAMNGYLYLGEYDKFIQSLPSNDSVYVLFYHGFGEYHLHNLSEAAHDFDRAYEMDPTLFPAIVGKALSYAIHGETAKGLALLHVTERRAFEHGVSDAEMLYKIAQAYAVLGDKLSALRLLYSTIEGGFFPYPYFVRDPLLNSLRQEPRFNVLMRQARERHEQFKARFF